MKYLIGIDVGTTGTKVVLITEAGKVEASAFEGYPLSSPQADWIEQDPEDWWKATIKAIAKAMDNASAKAGEIAGIGLCGQYHGAVLLDKAHHVLRPCILWCDQRTTQQAEYISRKIGKEELLRITGNPASYYFTACKILWVKDNEPQIYEKLSHFLLPKDYVRLKLTDNLVTDVTDASGTLLFDVPKRRWSSEIVDKLDLDKDILPACQESIEISGAITKKASELTGLNYGTPVVAGAGDQSAQAIGTGVIKEGLLACTMGTSGVVFAPTNLIRHDDRGRLDSFCFAIPDTWHTMGVMQSAGGSLRWFRDTLCKSEIRKAENTRQDVYQLIVEQAERVPAGSDNLIFLPYLSGERHPHSDAKARGIFFGLGMRHHKAHMIRSVLEGVAFGLRDSIEVMKELHLPISEIRATGGGARAKLWRQIVADVTNSKIVTVNSQEGAAYGTAILASVGSGLYNSVDEFCNRVIRVVEETYPIKDNVKRYEDYYLLYRSLYPLLKDKFAELSLL